MSPLPVQIPLATQQQVCMNTLRYAHSKRDSPHQAVLVTSMVMVYVACVYLLYHRLLLRMTVSIHPQLKQIQAAIGCFTLKCDSFLLFIRLPMDPLFSLLQVQQCVELVSRAKKPVILLGSQATLSPTPVGKTR